MTSQHGAQALKEPKRRISDADRVIGRAVRDHRVAAGLSQQELSATLGVTYQQLHKYERGINRITASTLESIAQSLNVPVEMFFRPQDEAQTEPRNRLKLELSRLFDMVPVDKQDALVNLARALATPSKVVTPVAA